MPACRPARLRRPGQASLEAAANPADVPYLYFVSRNDGSHAFATTLDEHNRNVFEYQIRYFRERRQGQETAGDRDSRQLLDAESPVRRLVVMSPAATVIPNLSQC